MPRKEKDFLRSLGTFCSLYTEEYDGSFLGIQMVGVEEREKENFLHTNLESEKNGKVGQREKERKMHAFPPSLTSFHFLGCSHGDKTKKSGKKHENRIKFDS